MNYLSLIGRILFALIFMLSATGKFSAEIAAFTASKGVPMANLIVPFTGIMELVGAVLLITGFRFRLGAIILLVFLLPVTLVMHNFWTIADPMMRQIDMASFMKNIAMMGALLFFIYSGPGPLVLGARKAKA